MTKLYTIISSILLFLYSTTAHGYHIASAKAGIDLDTQKISYVSGVINPEMGEEYLAQLMKTVAMPGARIIIINSPGGWVSVGENIINTMEQEKAQGVKQICIVTGVAHSMAFNILTHCDIRLAIENASMITHKVAIGGFDPRFRMTAKNLRKIAEQLDKTDEIYRQANAKAMHITVEEYDDWADVDTAWSAPQLLRMRYLDSIVKIK